MKVSVKSTNNSHKVLKYVSMGSAIWSALFILTSIILVVGAIVTRITGGSGGGSRSSESLYFTFDTIVSHPDVILYYIWIGTILLGWIFFITGIITSIIYLKKLQQQRLPLKLAITMVVTNIVGLLAVPASLVVVLLTAVFTCTGSC